MAIKSGISGTSTNTFTIGDGYTTNKTIYVNTASFYKPGIRYSAADGYFQKSDDGYNWYKIINSNDISPTTITHTITSAGSYQNASTTISLTNNSSVQYDIYTSIRKSDGYSHISVCNFGVTGTSGVYRFVGYGSSISELTAEQTCTFYESDDENNSVKFAISGSTLVLSYKGSAVGITCSSRVYTTNFVQPTIEKIERFRSADWWNGKTCSEWYLTQLQLLESQSMGGGPGQVCSYTHGATALSFGYIGSVLSSNGRVYLVPFSQATQTNWHYIDTNTGNVVAYAHGATAVDCAYLGGVLASNGRIYLIPAGQSNQSNWHYINTNTNVVTAYAHGATVLVNGYYGGVLAPNGRIYLVPSSQATQTNWHYIDVATGNVVAYAHGVTALQYAYYGGVLAPNGRIYLIPDAQATQTNWHYIDTTTGNVIAYAHGVTALQNAYAGGVLAPNGRIYLVPHSQATQTNWHYIDTNTGNIVAYTHGSTVVANAYKGGVLAPNGRIYMVPYNQATQTNWHYIDTNTGNVVAYARGATAVNFAYLGGALAPNGRIYFTPTTQCTQTTWHYINTMADVPFPQSVCLNPMFNKF